MLSKINPQCEPELQRSSCEQAKQGLTGQGRTFNEVSVPFMPIHHLFGLGGNAHLLFHAGVSDMIPAIRRNYWELDPFKGLYDPDPYHMPAMPVGRVPANAAE